MILPVHLQQSRRIRIVVDGPALLLLVPRGAQIDVPAHDEPRPSLRVVLEEPGVLVLDRDVRVQLHEAGDELDHLDAVLAAGDVLHALALLLAALVGRVVEIDDLKHTKRQSAWG